MKRLNTSNIVMLFLTTLISSVVLAAQSQPGSQSEPQSGPKAGSAQENENFRAKQPSPGPTKNFQLPEIQQFKLDNGIQVYLIEKHSLPTVTMGLQFEGGSAHDSDQQNLRTAMCVGLMDESTKSKDKIAFEEAQADLAASISASAGRESKSISLAALSKDLPGAFALFSELILQPGYRAEDLTRLKKASHESLKQSRASAESVANRVADTVVNGYQHPFGRVTVEKDIDAVQTSWCRDFHSAMIKPQGATLFVVGDVEQETIAKLFKTHLAAWQGAPAPLKKIPAPAPAAGSIFFVDVPNSVQSVIYFMDLAPSRLDKSYLPLQVASRVLGGGFASRINMNLREDKGYSYGAYGYVNYSKTFGYFRAGSSVRADSSFQSLLELNKEIQELAQGVRPVTNEELQREKNAMVLSMPARFATSRQSMGSYQELIDYGLPLDYYATLPAMVTELSPEEVAKAAMTQIKAEQMKIFIVGDAKSTLIERTPAKEGQAAKDVPMLKDGKALTLLEALRDYAKDKGGLVVLDADGKPIDKKT